MKRLLLALPLVLQLSGAAGLAALMCMPPEELRCCCCCAKTSGGDTSAPDVRSSCPCKMTPRDPAAPAGVPSATVDSRESFAATPAPAPAHGNGHLTPTFTFGTRATTAADPSPPPLGAVHLRC